MKEEGKGIQEQQVLEGEILPPLKKNQETVGSNPEREAPVVHLNLRLKKSRPKTRTSL